MAWNFFGGMPIYIQIAARIRLKIFSGEYPEGSKIPSVRDIASEASANPNTVVKALSMLCDEGIIYPKARRAILSRRTKASSMRQEKRKPSG